MPLSSYSLDTFVAQGLSSLDPPDLSVVIDEFPEQSSWLSSFVLNQMLRSHVPADRVPHAFILLRRAEAAFDEWALASEALARVKARRSVSAYFRALRHFENLVAMLYQSYDFARRMLGEQLFERGDGSVLQRLNTIYNDSRHFDPGDLPTGDLHAISITNDGLRSGASSLAYGELADLLRQIGRIAGAVSSGERLSP